MDKDTEVKVKRLNKVYGSSANTSVTIDQRSRMIGENAFYNAS